MSGSSTSSSASSAGSSFCFFPMAPWRSSQTDKHMPCNTTLKPLQDLQVRTNSPSGFLYLWKSVTEPWKDCSCLNVCSADKQLSREHKSVGAFASVPHQCSAVSPNMRETIQAMQQISTNDSNNIQNWHRRSTKALASGTCLQQASGFFAARVSSIRKDLYHSHDVLHFSEHCKWSDSNLESGSSPAFPSKAEEHLSHTSFPFLVVGYLRSKQTKA
jgi:hypothetical protein